MALKYNEGDKVRIKSKEWYDNNKDKYGNIHLTNEYGWMFTKQDSKFCDKIVTILLKDTTSYTIIEDNCAGFWTDEMIEGLAESTEDKMKELRKMCAINLTDSNYTDKVEILLNDYEYTEESGKSYFIKKKKEYPKTYEECAEIIKVGKEHTLEGTTIRINYKIALLESFQKLLICRDAYWKIAGEKMELGKSWEPDYDSGVNKYGIIFMNGVVQKSNPTTNWERHLNKVLDFPTEEMRDAFYENFKSEIVSCKEFL